MALVRTGISPNKTLMRFQFRFLRTEVRNPDSCSIWLFVCVCVCVDNFQLTDFQFFYSLSSIKYFSCVFFCGLRACTYNFFYRDFIWFELSWPRNQVVRTIGVVFSNFSFFSIVSVQIESENYVAIEYLCVKM